MNAPTWLHRPVHEFLPHRPPMVLIDRVVSVGEHHLESEVIIRHDSPFVRAGVVGAWVGVEYMAQTIATFAGQEADQRGDAVRVGFLLGTRDYRSTVPAFEVGAVLRVRVEQVHRELGGLSVVECQIRRAESATPVVEATLTVYEVPDIQEYLAQHRGQP